MSIGSTPWLHKNSVAAIKLLRLKSLTFWGHLIPGNRGFLFLHTLVERPLDDLQLLLSAETAEVHGVAGNTDGQSRIFFRMLHGVDEELPVHDVDV